MWPKPAKISTMSDLARIIPELNEISEIEENRLYLSGSMPVTKKNLNKLGITAIICAINEDEERQNFGQQPHQNQFSHLRTMYVRLVDTPSSDLSAYFRSATSFIDNELRNGGKVLVHCVAGVSRSVSLILAYLIRFGGYSSLDAFLMVRSKRSIARPNDGFCMQLMDYERGLNKYSKRTSASSSVSSSSTNSSILTELDSDFCEEDASRIDPGQMAPMGLF